MPRANTPRPPRFLRSLIAACLPFEDRASVCDELDALYEQREASSGVLGARFWYMRQVLGFVARAPLHLASLAGSLSMELRVALRMFRRRRAYAAAFILTLALGTAVIATTYTVADWLLLRPVPGIRDPDPLLTIQVGMPSAPPHVSWDVSQPDFETLSTRLDGLARFASMTRVDLDVRAGDGPPYRVGGEMVSDDYFELLGTHLIAGRSFKGRGANERGVIVSAAFARRVADDPSIAVGKALNINGALYTIVGVAERGFRGAELPGRSDVWIPTTALWSIDPEAAPTALSQRGYGIWNRVFARVNPGVAPAEVESAANAVVAATRREFRDHSFNALEMRYQAFRGIGLDPGVRPSVRATLQVISSAAILLLLLTIANVSNLALANEASRGPLVGIQRALGATRSRIATGRVVESALLGAVACMAALSFSVVCARLLDAIRLSARGAPLAGLELSSRGTAFTLIVALLGAGLAATIGATLTRSTDVTDLLRRGATVGVASHRVRSGLVGLQVALSLMLLLVAGMLGRTVQNLRRIDLGFSPDGLMTFSIDPRLHGLSGIALQAMLAEIESDLGTRTGGAAGFIGPSPLGGNYLTGSLYAGPDSTDRRVIGAGYYVTPGFLSAIGARVIAGDRAWRADSGTVVITRSMADSLFPMVDPRGLVGRTVMRRRKGANPVTIAAVIEDLRLGSVKQPPVPTLLRPLSEGSRDLSVRGLVRSSRGESVATAAVYHVVGARAPDVPVFDVLSARAVVDRQFAERTSMSIAARTLAVFGVLLAAAGLYGVLSTIVVARQRELAIRIALGASAMQVHSRIFRAGLVPVIAGLVVGTLGCILATRIIRAQLYGLDGFDALSYAAGVALLLIIAAAACLIPARRAARVSPDQALRAE